MVSSPRKYYKRFLAEAGAFLKESSGAEICYNLGMGRGSAANSEVISAALRRSEQRRLGSQTGRIHYPLWRSEQNKMNPEQIAKAEQLADQGVEVYIEGHRSSAITSSFRNYLKSGDARKITRALYTFLTMKCGYIAHFDLNNFRSVYANPADFLRGEGKARVWNPGNPQGVVEHSQNVYSDAKTSVDVYREMLSIVANA